ncbi:MAG: DUF2279 domain-containing protein [Saprospiraceae bacterium]|nr:DUF2279 domain-containing protein [Saprospiraceae bacterium]
MQVSRPIIFICLCCLLALTPNIALGQKAERLPFLEPADTFNNARFWTCAIAGTAIYTGFSIALYETWYKDYELTVFHTFNDWGEWRDMDKMGHLFTAAMESRLAFGGALWTGMDRRSAMWTGAAVSTLLQTTIEVMDGFSAKWGFSWGDVAYNTLGTGVFVAQEMLWEEQRITLKVSNTQPKYSTKPIASREGTAFSSPRQRARELFGEGFFETFLKDYNGMTIWASVNINAFLPTHKQNRGIPKWLNVAVGYGANGLYGGFGNTWTDDNGAAFNLSASQFPRYNQFYLSLDIDLSRIPTQNRFLKSLLNAIHWIKIPAPTLEWDTRGGMKGHWLYW